MLRLFHETKPTRRSFMSAVVLNEHIHTRRPFISEEVDKFNYRVEENAGRVITQHTLTLTSSISMLTHCSKQFSTLCNWNVFNIFSSTKPSFERSHNCKHFSDSSRRWKISPGFLVNISISLAIICVEFICFQLLGFFESIQSNIFRFFVHDRGFDSNCHLKTYFDIITSFDLQRKWRSGKTEYVGLWLVCRVLMIFGRGIGRFS